MNATNTGRGLPYPEIQQMPGAAEKQIAAMAVQITDLQRQRDENGRIANEAQNLIDDILAANQKLQRDLAERESELRELVHPHDLEKYRNGK